MRMEAVDIESVFTALGSWATVLIAHFLLPSLIEK